MRVPESLYRKWDESGRIPLWAQIVWPRLHFCDQFDELLTGDESPSDAPFLCACVSWPHRFHAAQEQQEPPGPNTSGRAPF